VTPVHTPLAKCDGERMERVLLYHANFPDSEPYLRCAGSKGGARAGCARGTWVHVRACPLLARSVYLFVPRCRPLPWRSVRYWWAAPRPRARPEHPRVTPKHLESRTYRLPSHIDLRRPAKTWARSLDHGTQFPGFPHPSILACVHAYNKNPWTEARRVVPRPGYGLTTPPPNQLSPLRLSPGPLPEGRTTQLRKGAEERNPRLRGAR
jgi:hypothetical protein